MGDTEAGWAAVVAVTIGALVGAGAHLVDQWSARRWGAHPDRAWWAALVIISLLTAGGALWLALAGVR